MEPDHGPGVPARLGRRIGYARVSTEDQRLSLQLDALGTAKCDRIFHDGGFSGAALNRPALDEALGALEPGDTLIVWKLDRLGRSLAHLINVVGSLGARGIGFCSLTESIDTTTAGGRLVFHVLGALAEFERCLISERTKAGMVAARGRGANIGRPPKLSGQQITDAKALIETGSVDIDTLARSLGVSPLTLERALKRQDLAA